ncbi:MAG TPA: PriCT-2 domain-containing protein, partial [Dyadobacter sp.]|nr:PriCT-2 domain-containing protein [Dyadobacter sp.]
YKQLPCTTMESVLNVRVSKFENYFQPEPADTILWHWLKDRSQDDLVEALRTIEDKKERDALKAKLSGVTVSGRFENPRSLNTLIEHSGLICIDVDPKENPDIENYGEFKAIVGKAPFVAYAGLSASGRGYFVIIPIAHPDKHIQHFLALQAVFEKIGVKIDPACKDVSRLRGRTFDPDPYVNHQAKKFTALLEPPKPKPRNTSFQYRHLNGNNTQAAVERRIKELLSRRVDLTSSYNEWVTQGFAIASEFGENGRDYFHDISSVHPEYNADECEKQYDKCVKGRGNGVTIASFFYACNAAGIQVGGFTPVEYGQRPAMSQAEAITRKTGISENQLVTTSAKKNSTSDNQSLTEENATNATTLKREDQPFEANTQISGNPESAEFDLHTFQQWAKTLPKTKETGGIRLKTLIDDAPYDKVFLPRDFAIGRLQSIESWTGEKYRGRPENPRSLHIRQLVELKSILNNKSI